MSLDRVKVDTGRLLDEKQYYNELDDIFNFYIKAYNLSDDKKDDFGTFNEMTLYQAPDGAGVFFHASTSLTGNGKFIKENAMIGMSIPAFMMNVACYFLARKVKPEDVPDELRLCQAVCHSSSHWTGLLSTIKSFRTFYNSLYTQCLGNIDYNVDMDVLSKAIGYKLGVYEQDDKDKKKVRYISDVETENKRVKKKPEDGYLYIKATSKGLKYVVHMAEQDDYEQSHEAVKKRGLIRWEDLPNDMPRTEEDIIKSKDKWMLKILEQTSKAHHTFKPTSPESILFGRVKRAINNYLGVVEDKGLDSNIASSVKIIRAVGSDNIQIDHFDSMNSPGNYGRKIARSLYKLTVHNILPKVSQVEVSQQGGQTCGDHTVINLFMAAMFGLQPEINKRKRGATSWKLRQLTDAIKSKKEGKAEGKKIRTKELVCLAGTLMNSPGSKPLDDAKRVTIDVENEDVADANHELYKLVKRLMELCPKYYKQLIAYAREKNNDAIDELADKHERNKKIQEGCDLARKLIDVYNAKLIKATQYIYGDMTDEERKNYGPLAFHTVEDACAELESLRDDEESSDKSLTTSEQETESDEQSQVESDLKSEDALQTEMSNEESDTDEDTKSDKDTSKSSGKEKAKKKQNEAEVRQAAALKDAIKEVKEKIGELDQYGHKLQTALEKKKGGEVRKLAGILNKYTDAFDNLEIKEKTPLKFKEYEQQCRGAIANIDLSHYRMKHKSTKETLKSVGKILFNIGLAITGVGLFVLAGRLVYTSNRHDRATFFFVNPRTTSERKVEKVEGHLDKLSRVIKSKT